MSKLVTNYYRQHIATKYTESGTIEATAGADFDAGNGAAGAAGKVIIQEGVSTTPQQVEGLANG